MSRWTKFLITVILGGAAGLFYGWRVNPVEYVDITPDSLRVDYKTDFVLMVAESYQVDHNLGLAVRRLALLGNASPTDIVAIAINYTDEQNRASQNTPDAHAVYDSQDIALLLSLHDAVLNWNPNLEAPTP
jgi:hypothetical protein